MQSSDDEDNIRLSHFDEQNNPNQGVTTKLWRMLAVLLFIMVALFFTSMILCFTNDHCRNHIPTVSNMLNSTFSAPFITSGMNAALGIHLITSAGIYYMTEHKAFLWSWMQMFMACGMYLCVIITMLVFPFTGWETNWANLAIIITTILWMTCVVVALWRYYNRKMSGKKRLVRWNVAFLVLFLLCSIIYIVLRSVHMSVVPKDDGIVVVEIVGGISFFLFMILCVIHIAGLQISIK